MGSMSSGGNDGRFHGSNVQRIPAHVYEAIREKTIERRAREELASDQRDEARIDDFRNALTEMVKRGHIEGFKFWRGISGIVWKRA